LYARSVQQVPKDVQEVSRSSIRVMMEVSVLCIFTIEGSSRVVADHVQNHLLRESVDM